MSKRGRRRERPQNKNGRMIIVTAGEQDLGLVMDTIFSKLAGSKFIGIMYEKAEPAVQLFLSAGETIDNDKQNILRNVGAVAAGMLEELGEVSEEAMYVINDILMNESNSGKTKALFDYLDKKDVSVFLFIIGDLVQPNRKAV